MDNGEQRTTMERRIRYILKTFTTKPEQCIIGKINSLEFEKRWENG